MAVRLTSMNPEDLRHLLRGDGDLVAMMELGLRGLTDHEYLWEPVEGCWSVRARSKQRTPPNQWLPDGEWGLDLEYPDPAPAPFTTIAWRMTHLIGSTYIGAALLRGKRLDSGHLDERWDEHTASPRTAAEAVDRWHDAIGKVQSLLANAKQRDLERTETHEWGLGEPGTGQSIGRALVYFAYFEPASHAAEVRLLRDLYRHTRGGEIPLLSG
jgi:hypothetical protein